jgi:hypothetical protein
MHLPRATFANVLSCLALFVALGGASYAAVSLPMNSVGTKQIKSASINNSKVKKGSLLRNAFKAGQLPAGKRGKRGVRGARGVAGLAGVAGVAGVGTKLAASGSIPAQAITADGAWHTYASSTFSAAANTVYQQVQDTNYTQFTVTGADCGNTSSYIVRETVNGVPTAPADANGFSYIPGFFGSYPAGTSITLAYQYQVICATQTLNLPAGSVYAIPYQLS